MFKLQYRYYLLGMLTITSAFIFLDRGLFSLALEPIKQEFELSDSQLGLMGGFAFTSFYALAGMPIALWADRGNRNYVISITVGLWSLMMVMSGIVGTFLHLILVRVGVAVGEAGCAPPAQSLISDYFNRAERPRAMSIYWMCVPLSIILSYLGGGFIIEQYGWRSTFMMVGIPGICLALVVRLSLREPRLQRQKGPSYKINVASNDSVCSIPLNVVLKTLIAKHSFRHLLLAYCISSFFGTGITIWLPAFFMRTYNMGAGELGVWFGLAWGVAGLFATLFGGFLATRYAPENETLQMRGIALIFCLATVFHTLCYSVSDQYVALVFVSLVTGFLFPMTAAPAYAAIQSLVETRMRAVGIAFIFMLSNLIGMGLGPLAVGIVSDMISPIYDQESLRITLMLFSPGYLWGAYHAWRASYSIEDDIRSVEDNSTLVDNLEIVTR